MGECLNLAKCATVQSRKCATVKEGLINSPQMRDTIALCRGSSMQLTFGDAEGLGKRKQTRREIFL
ncbi:hypothetical protein TP46_03475, partial [Xanthomonas citri pv. aurantifolii]